MLFRFVMGETVDARAEAPYRLYRAAIDVLGALHKHPAGPLKPYDRAELQREAGLFVDWYCPAVGLTVDGEGYRAAWDAVLVVALDRRETRSEEHTSELQSLMRLSSAVFCLKKNKPDKQRRPT